IEKINILDPSCGEGIFLKTAISILHDLKSNFYKNSANSKKLSDEEIYQHIIFNNIHGIDINFSKIDEYNQRLLDTFHINSTSRPHKPIKFGNALIDDHNYPFYLNWDETFKSVMEKGGFDIIIGNPPWGANIKPYKSYLQKKYPSIAKGQFDSFSIFLYKSLKELLKENGILAFIVPNEVCFLDQYTNLRKYLLTYKILEIINLGFAIFIDVQKPALLLILRKSRMESQNHKVLVSVDFSQEEKSSLLADYDSLTKLIKDKHYIRPQDEFSKYKSCIFDIFSDPIDRIIMDKIDSNNFKSLGTYFRSGRGIDTNKQGKFFICPKCKTLNPPFGRGHSGRIKRKYCLNDNCDFIFETTEISEYETIELISDHNFPREGYNAPGYIGEDLRKIHFKRPPRAIKYYPTQSKINQGKVHLNFESVSWGKDYLYDGEKILIRKVATGNNLLAMVYSGFLVTNQQIYIFKKKENVKDISLYYFLGILISRLIHYYYINKFGDPYKKILPHFTQTSLKSLPIPVIPKTQKRYKNIIRIVKEMLSSTSKKHISPLNPLNSLNKKNLSQLRDLYSQLDQEIFLLYNIIDKKFQQEIIARADDYGFELW
ncbi:MAG: N-6 DNA methylase, partial [Promethearchaeia archaeon]